MTVQAGAIGGAPRARASGAEFSNRQILALFAILAVIASIPIALYPWPPFGDYINHLARMHVISAGGADANLARFYQVDWQVIPNLMMDLIVPALGRALNVYLAGQIYTAISFALILSGTLALNRQLYGAWSALPLIAFPLLYNQVFFVGTMNYVFGVGLSLWALTAWAALRERGLALRLAVSTLFVLALFFCHLFSVGTYGLGVLAFEMQRLWTRRQEKWRPAALIDFAASGLPFVPTVPLLLLSPTWGLTTFRWELAGKLDGLIFVIEAYSHVATILLAAIVVSALAWWTSRRALKFHPFGWALLIVGGLTYFAMPRIMFDTYMADQRLPISLAFMVIACAHLTLRGQVMRRGFATLLVLVLAVRVLEVQTVWHELSLETDSFRNSVRLVDRGSKVLVAYADPTRGDDMRELWLTHAACLAIIERSALVTTAFTVIGKQVMHARADYRAEVDTEDGTPPSVKQLVQSEDRPAGLQPAYWQRWTEDYDYLYVLFTGPNYENPDPALLTPVYAGARFVLYRIGAGSFRNGRDTARATPATTKQAKSESPL